MIGYCVLENVYSCLSCYYEFLIKVEFVDYVNINKYDCDFKLCCKYKYIMFVLGNDLYCYFWIFMYFFLNFYDFWINVCFCIL